MARAFGSGKYLLNTAGAITVLPVTLSTWVNVTTLVSNNVFFLGSETGYIGIGLGYVTSGRVDAVTSGSGGEQVAESTVGTTVDVWAHCCAVFTSTSSRTAYYNGGSAGNQTNITNPGSISAIAIGCFYDGTNAWGLCNGAIAECAVWDVELTAGEIAALAGGVSPTRIRPANLGGYWPINGIDSPERDFSPGILSTTRRSMTMTGTAAQSNHPPVSPAPFLYNRHISPIYAEAPPDSHLNVIPTGMSALPTYGKSPTIIAPTRSRILGRRAPADTWIDHFTALSGFEAPNYLWNGRWGDCIYRFSFLKTLAANGDSQFWVHDENDFGSGTMASALIADGWGSGPFLHVQAGSTIRLRAYPVSLEQSAKVYGYRYISGSLIDNQLPLNSTGKQFGTWTIRFRFNSFGVGHHLALWLLSDAGNYPPEIDILEVVNGQSIWHCALHTIGGGGDFFIDYDRPGGANDWHIAEVEVNPSVIIWRMNSTVVHQATYVASEVGEGCRWYYLVTWEISTNWTGPPDGTTPWPADFEIDYIRYTSLT